MKMQLLTEESRRYYPRRGTIYNRFTLELRYPISMNQTAKIYALTFAEGGNVWNSWGSYNPFQLKRSVGVGVRVYMGAFG
jgi:outer membrane protein insertion porin family